tara:strand:- start:18716 stop:20119 length:1404 start_codon:yes stop_codon:yes gene_type:complete
MRKRYFDLIDQTFDFPQEEFNLSESRSLTFHGIDLMELVKEYGTPLKFNYLPKISENIQKSKRWFNQAITKTGYQGKYEFAYCTKSSHFSFVLDEVLKNEVHLETSSSYDIDIINHLIDNGKLTGNEVIICNGFKQDRYIERIAELIDRDFVKVIPVIDNKGELDRILELCDRDIEIGIRIASEEDPKFEFYTSRLGIRYKEILPFYEERIASNDRVSLKMLHFFINTGIKDNAYYWNELSKSLRVYSKLAKVCESLIALNIGGGFPIKKSLGFDYDYEYMVEEIILQIKGMCDDHNLKHPDIYTEFGSFTVGESGGAIFSIIDQKQQNDREKWNMIDSSFMTNLPDTWAINQRFIMLPINRWDDEYERVLLGGLTCDSDDYYNSEQHANAIYLPKFDQENPLYIGFFNTGAYQETIGGFGGLKHCLIPEPRHILIDRDEKGEIRTRLFAEEQNSDQYLKLLGYKKT